MGSVCPHPLRHRPRSRRVSRHPDRGTPLAAGRRSPRRKTIILIARRRAPCCLICLALIAWRRLANPRFLLAPDGDCFLAASARSSSGTAGSHFDDLLAPRSSIPPPISASITHFWLRRRAASFLPTLVPAEKNSPTPSPRTSIFFQIRRRRRAEPSGFLIARRGSPFHLCAQCGLRLDFFLPGRADQKIREARRVVGARGAAWWKGFALSSARKSSWPRSRSIFSPSCSAARPPCSRSSPIRFCIAARSGSAGCGRRPPLARLSWRWSIGLPPADAAGGPDLALVRGRFRRGDDRLWRLALVLALALHAFPHRCIRQRQHGRQAKRSFNCSPRMNCAAASRPRTARFIGTSNDVGALSRG